MRLPGSSKPRRFRRDSLEQELRVAVLPVSLATPLRRDIQVTTIVQSLNPRGKHDGPTEESAQVRHRLNLTRGDDDGPKKGGTQSSRRLSLS